MCWRAAHSEFRRCPDTYEASSTVSRAPQGRRPSSICGLYPVAGGARGCMPQWVLPIVEPLVGAEVGETSWRTSLWRAAGTGSVTGRSSSNAAAPQGPERGSSLRHRNLSRAHRGTTETRNYLRCLAKSWEAFAMPTMPRSLSHISQRLQGDPVTPEYRANQRGRDRQAGPDRIEIKKHRRFRPMPDFLS